MRELVREYVDNLSQVIGQLNERGITVTDLKRSNLYKLHDRITGDVAYYRAFNKAGARNRHITDRFTVDALSVEEALKLEPKDIVDATTDPAQQALL